MARFFQKGQTVNYVNETGSPIMCGSVVMLGTHPAVAVSDIGNGEMGAVMTEGVFEFLKDSSTFALGDDVYAKTATSEATSTASENKKIGYAIKKANSSDSTVLVKLCY